MHSALFKNLCYDQVAYQQKMFERIIKVYVPVTVDIYIWDNCMEMPLWSDLVNGVCEVIKYLPQKDI